MQKFYMSPRPVEIKHFNTRTEGRGDEDDVLRGDLKIKASGNCDDLDNWLWGDQVKVSDLFYTESGALRVLGLKPLRTSRKLENLVAKVRTIDVEPEVITFEGVTINGLEIDLLADGQITVVCSMQVDPVEHMEAIGRMLVDGRAHLELALSQGELEL